MLSPQFHVYFGKTATAEGEAKTIVVTKDEETPEIEDVSDAEVEDEEENIEDYWKEYEDMDTEDEREVIRIAEKYKRRGKLSLEDLKLAVPDVFNVEWNQYKERRRLEAARERAASSSQDSEEKACCNNSLKQKGASVCKEKACNSIDLNK